MIDDTRTQTALALRWKDVLDAREASMGASELAPAGERPWPVAPGLDSPSGEAGAGTFSPAPASPRIDEAPGDNWPWVVEEPAEWRTRTSADSRRLRRACAGLMVFAGALLVGTVLVQLAGRAAGWWA